MAGWELAPNYLDFERAVKTADSKLDQIWLVDEQKVIDKVLEVSIYFSEFETKNLPKLRASLSEKAFDELKWEFSKLKENFYSDIKQLKAKLELHDEMLFDEYNMLLRDFQDEFWWVLEIKEWDTIWDIATKYVWLPKDGKASTYSWFQLADWMAENQKVTANNLKVWDVVIVPSEYSALKDLFQNSDVFDLETLLNEWKIVYKPEFEKLPKDEQFDALRAIYKYLNARWWSNDLSPLLIKIYAEHLVTQLPPEDVKLAEKLWEDKWVIEWIIEKELNRYDDEGKDYSGIRFFKWLADWFYYWMFKQLDAYRAFLSWDVFQQIYDFLESLAENPWDTLAEMWDSICEAMWFDEFDFSLPHTVWRSFWAMYINIVLWALCWFVGWLAARWVMAWAAAVKGFNKIKIPDGQIDKIEWVLVNNINRATAWAKEFTGNVNFSNMNMLKWYDYSKLRNLWINMAYHSWEIVAIACLDAKRLYKVLTWEKWIDVNWVKVIKDSAWKEVIALDPYYLAWTASLWAKRWAWTADNLDDFLFALSHEPSEVKNALIEIMNDDNMES